MKAAVFYEIGSPEVLRYEDRPDPVIGPEDVLIGVEAISIEGGDLLNRRVQPPPMIPHIVGYQAGGTVLAVGAKVTRLEKGDRVAGFNWWGSHASLFAVPETFAYPVPSGLDMLVAATIPVAFGTADDALFDRGQLQSGETVLIHGGAGGVGLAAIQLAKAAGATVFATASGEDRAARLVDFGADHALDYRAVNVPDAVLEVTNGRGVDLLVDLVGGAALNKLAQAVTYRGRVSIVGAASGDFSGLGFVEIVSKGLAAYGVSFGQEMHLARTHDMIARHMTDAASGKLRMPIDRTFPLSEAAAAHDYVERSHPFGRVVMVP